MPQQNVSIKDVELSAAKRSLALTENATGLNNLIADLCKDIERKNTRIIELEKQLEGKNGPDSGDSGSNGEG